MKIFSAICTSAARLDGKTVIVTGSNSGLGKFTAKDLFMRGARVIMACRSVEKAQEAANEITEMCKDEQKVGVIVIAELDLSSFKSIRSCAQRLLETEKRIDILVNNAGVFMCPQSKTEDGFELHFGTNHLGHFLLTLLLLPKIYQSTPARIVNISSVFHLGVQLNFDDLNCEKRKYDSLLAYKQSKLANILFTRELARKIKEHNIKGINVYSVHPGIIKTDLDRHVRHYIPWMLYWVIDKFCWFLKTLEQGAQTAIYCAVDEKCAQESGLYYAECEVKEPSNAAKNDEDAKKLWDISLKFVNLKGDPFEF